MIKETNGLNLIMSNRVYYGEYSLKHWVNLMLSRNIELPKYQRHFVWQERDIKRLVKSLKEGQFVQPVTIAMYNVAGEKHNLILDGQQRLTSILLAYLGYLPNRTAFKNMNVVANEDDSEDEENDQNIERPIQWKYDLLLGDDNQKGAVKSRLAKKAAEGFYSPMTDELFMGLEEQFFENTYMGFSYIIPESTEQNEVQMLFSKLFRNINYFGKKLDAQESRKSLYYQNNELTCYFEGKTEEEADVLCGLKIKEALQPCNIDFVRYLSILSQFKSKGENANRVLVGYSSYGSRESYYADYVSYILNQGRDEQESRNDKFDLFTFSDVFPDNCWKERYCILRNTVERLKDMMPLDENKAFGSWQETDYWLFGLIYHIVFNGKTLKDDLTIVRTKRGRVCTITLQDRINHVINSKRTAHYKNNINRLCNLRERLQESCGIYKDYVQ